jgi:hypothetical protein
VITKEGSMVSKMTEINGENLWCGWLHYIWNRGSTAEEPLKVAATLIGMNYIDM